MAKQNKRKKDGGNGIISEVSAQHGFSSDDDRNLIDNGTLYMVATPIGNLADISLRALKILKEVDFIAAEDTRHTAILLNKFEIKKPLESYFEHNKAQKGDLIIKRLLAGESAALVSDAGMPGISDPGEDLVRLAIRNGVKVTIIPGPSAAISALVISGMPTGRFVFEGFLPVNSKMRKKRIDAIKNDTRTIILYEAPHKLNETLRNLAEGLGDRNIAVARELTKKFEQIIRCTISEAIEWFSLNEPRGEFVLVIEGLSEEELLQEKQAQWDKMSISEHVDMYIRMGEDKKEAIRMTSEDRGIAKREVYNDYIKNKDIG